MPPDTHESHALTSASVECVWAELQRPETWASIGGVERTYETLHDDAGNLVSYRFDAIIGGKTYPGDARTTVAEAPRLMTVVVDSKDLSGAINVRIDPVGSGTRIEVSTAFSPKGFLASLMLGAISSAVARGMPERVERLARRCEAD